MQTLCTLSTLINKQKQYTYKRNTFTPLKYGKGFNAVLKSDHLVRRVVRTSHFLLTLLSLLLVVLQCIPMAFPLYMKCSPHHSWLPMVTRFKQMKGEIPDTS